MDTDVVHKFRVNPENLPMEKQLPEVKKNLKVGYKKMLSEDMPKKEKK